MTRSTNNLATYQQIERSLKAGRLAEAEAALKTHLQVHANDANLQHLSGVCYQLQQQWPKAAAAFGRATALQPNWFEANLNMAECLRQAGRWDEAAQAATHAHSLQQGHPAPLIVLADVAEKQGQLNDSCRYLREAYARGLKSPEFVSNLHLKHRAAALWDIELPELDEKFLTPAASVMLTDDVALQRRVAERYCAAYFPQIPARPALPQPAERLRIGYISSDFHHHATAFLTAELFALHDKNAFETYVYSFGPNDGSAIRARIQNTAEHWVDLAGSTLNKAAQVIREHNLHILIDLKGHTRGNVLPLMAMRLAPIQAHYLGHPGPIGGAAIDYIIGDPVVTPHSVDAHYPEHIVRLPHTYQINDRVRLVDPPLPRSAHGLPEQGLVLACFNQIMKITPEVFDVWLRALKAVNTAVLWLYATQNDTQNNLRKRAEQQGINPERLVFAASLPNPQHLARYALADVVLDTFPYTSHTTASDALWMGAPILTRAGNTFAGRVATCLMQNAGLPSFVTTTADEYDELLNYLIRAPEELAETRQYLLNTRMQSALFDTPRFVKHLESAYQMMWQKAQTGVFESFDIPA